MINQANAEWLALRQQVMEKDFKRMNSMQRQAVFTTEGPMLVLAGAGSGKTTVLVNRIANLVRYGMAYDSAFLDSGFSQADAQMCQEYIAGRGALPPELTKRLAVQPCPAWKVMAITFTNKAAGELKERLCDMLGGDEGQQIWASTFHSSCARMLRRDADRLGYTAQFAIYDMDDSRRVMKDCLKRLEIDEKFLSTKAALSEISRAKDAMLTPEEYLKEAGEDYRLKLIGNVYQSYQNSMEGYNAMDFDDLLVNTVRLFQKCPDVLGYYQNRFRYIMVDEYQDTNHVQYEFIRLLAQGSGNLCVVGDDDQSIYKFRGATIENILNFEKDYPGATVVRLEQNYRSTQNILNAANAVIANNTGRKGKNLWTESGAGEKLRFHIAENEQEEADHIARRILDGVAEGRKFSDYAVLYRMNSQSLAFERMFAKQGVPHRIIGGMRFYERQEIRDMLAYLNLINNPNDLIRLRRIIGRPKRGIGERSLDTVIQISEELERPVLDVMADASSFPALTRAAGKLRKFAELILGLIALNAREDIHMTELFESLLEQTGYLTFLREDEPAKAEDRIDNIGELMSNIQRYEQETENATYAGFLEEIALITDIDNYAADTDAVVLMTIHSAKGLEFPCLFLPGWEENVFPGASVTYNPAEAEEERRLAYVAITRAREQLAVYAAETRMVFGQTNRNRPSRFLQEIPEELMEYSRSSGYHAGTMPSFSFGQEKGAQTMFARDTKEFQNHTYKPKPPSVKASTEQFSPGDTVAHRAFGTGLVISADRIANDTLLEVSFEKVGTKKLFQNFANLKKL